MLSKNAKLWLGFIAVVSLMSLASSCKPSDGGDGVENPPTGKTYTAKGNEGTISGVISYTGTAPEAKKIDTRRRCGLYFEEPEPDDRRVGGQRRQGRQHLRLH